MKSLLLFFLFLAQIYAEYSIEHVTILLPTVFPSVSENVDTGIVDFHLKAYGGCFDWEPETDPIIDIRPDHTKADCPPGTSQGVMIRPKITTSAFLGRQNSWIEAKLDGETIARCEVFIDKIHSLELLTSTRRMSAGEVESIYVQAFDAHQNVFSSLEGIPFEWTNSAPNVLSIVPFEEAGVNVTQLRLDMQHENILTDNLLVRGVQRGKSNITAKLTDPSNPVGVTVELTVTEPLKLTPSKSVIFVHQVLELLLQTGDRDKTWKTVPMPSPQYQWSVSHPKVLDINKASGLITGKDLGQSEIIVEDIHFKEHRETAEVHVAEPGRIHLNLRPTVEDKKSKKRSIPRVVCDNHWHIVQGTNYSLEIMLYAKDGATEMTLSSNTLFHVNLEGTSVKKVNEENPVNAKVPSDTIFVPLFATAYGATTINVKIQDVIDPITKKTYKFPTPLTATASILVTSQLQLEGKEIVLPLTPSASKVGTFQIEAHGGSGKRNWSSENKAVAEINGMGVLSVKSLGVSRLRVVDQCDPENFATAPVLVVTPSKLSFLPGPREVAVNQIKEIAVVVSDAEGRNFTNCSNLHIIPSIAQGVALSIVSAPGDSLRCQARCPLDIAYSCWVLQLKAFSAGFVELRAVLDQEDLAPGALFGNADGTPTPGLITTCTELSGYEPIELSDSELIVAQGSHVNLTWSRGPLPWPQTGFTCSGGLNSIRERSVSPSVLYKHVPGQTTLTSAAFSYGFGSWDELQEKGVDSIRKRGPFGLDITPHADTIHAFTVNCVEHSNKSIALEIVVANTPVPSNPAPVANRAFLRVQCFPRLTLTPPILSLGVGAQRQLQLPPTHPLLKNVTFFSDDPEIATVNSDGTVTGVALGETVVHAHVPHPSGKRVRTDPDVDGLHAVSRVVVRFDGFVIKMRSCEFLQDQSTVVHVEGVNGEMPGDRSFNFVRCRWTVDSPFVQLFPLTSVPQPNELEQSIPIHGCSITVVAQRPGNVTLTANISVSDPSQGGTPSLHEIKQGIIVMEPLRVLSSEFVLLPPGASTQISTNLDGQVKLQYTVLEDPALCGKSNATKLIRIDNRGYLRTSNETSDVVVLISTVPDARSSSSFCSNRARSKQTVSVRISVRPVEQLGISPVQTLVGPLCVGKTLAVSVVLKDELGRPFNSLNGWSGSHSEKKGALTFRSIHPELLRVLETDNKQGSNGVLSSLSLTALNSLASDDQRKSPQQKYSTAIVKLWLSDYPNILPVYLRVDVADAPHCETPPGVVFSSVFSQNVLSGIPPHTPKRKAWEANFASSIAKALRISPTRVIVCNAIDSSSFPRVEYAILPRNTLELVHAQWHLSHLEQLPDSLDTSKPTPTAAGADWDTSDYLINTLHFQLADPISTLRNQSLTRYLNVTTQTKISPPSGTGLSASTICPKPEPRPEERVIYERSRPGETRPVTRVVVEEHYEDESAFVVWQWLWGWFASNSLVGYFQLFFMAIVTVSCMLLGLILVRSRQAPPSRLNPVLLGPDGTEGPGSHHDYSSDSFWSTSPSISYTHDDQ